MTEKLSWQGIRSPECMTKFLQTINQNFMKRILKMCSIILLVVLFSTARNKVAAQETTVSYQTFYDDLSPYGQWIDYPNYGYVWHPSANDFRPYSTGGHWVWTDDYGWMWASDYDWGWAPFHYGRWLYDDLYGWVWVPGYEWSPAWVEWRTGGDYYGWAPLGPGIDINLNFSFGRNSVPYNYWCFVPRNYILSPRVYDYCVPQNRNTVIINNTTVINNYHRANNVFVTGPERRDVERYTGRINPFVVRQSSKPGRTQLESNTVRVFRPQVQKNENHLAPKTVTKYKRQNGNAFQQRNRQDIANSQRREQQGNPNAFQRREEDVNKQNEIRRQQEQNNIVKQQQENKSALERRQNQMRQQQEQKRQQSERNSIEQRQNEARQQQQRNNEEKKNAFDQRQQEIRQQQQDQRSMVQQRQNEARQQQRNSEQRQNEMRQQQQRNNSFRQRQHSQNNDNGNAKKRDRQHG